MMVLSGRWRQLVALLFILLLLTASSLAIRHELKEYGWSAIVESWQQIPKLRQLGAIALTGLGYLTMTAYDLLGFQYIQQALAVSKIAFTAFLSYAIGNTVGFTALSGTAIRYRFYGGWGVPQLKIAKLIIFTHLSFWLGISAVSGLVFSFDPLTLPQSLKLPFDTVHPLGLIFLVIVAIYFSASFLWKKPLMIGNESLILPSPQLSIASIIISLLDWGLASGVLYSLLPVGFPLSYAGFFGIYLVAMVAGLISTVPGGLGVFETVILFLRPDSVPAPAVLGALLVYRGIYYFLPLIVALILLIIQSLHRRG